jgi:hypothetical protein
VSTEDKAAAPETASQNIILLDDHDLSAVATAMWPAGYPAKVQPFLNGEQIIASALRLKATRHG